jgi:hypothetical protein
MFKKFQQKIIDLMENIPLAPSPASSNSTAGGVFGPNATQNTFQNTPIHADMSIAGGVNPPKKKQKKSKKYPKIKSRFPVARRPLSNMSQTF